LQRYFDRRGATDAALEADPLLDDHTLVAARARTLGVRLAELHRAFATETGDPAFDPEPVTAAEVAAWTARASETAEAAFAALEREAARIPEDVRADVAALQAERAAVLARFAVVRPDASLRNTRYHGDFHLGQVLVVADDVLIVDFEGEPHRDLAARRRKSSPLRDVAGMVRSFNYAKVAALRGTSDDRAADRRVLEPLADAWERRTVGAFLEGYRATIGDAVSYPRDPAVAQALLDVFLLEKAFYEISYELANRPAWLRIPLEGIRAILTRDLEPVG
jgi:maltose alpha-D-glucosyltransferase/alpha-amylase